MATDDAPTHLGPDDDDGANSDESRDPLEESGCTHDGSDEEEVVEESVAEDMDRFEESFEGITKRYRLINRIGEGPRRPAPVRSSQLTAGRNLLHRLQGRGPAVRPVSERLGR